MTVEDCSPMITYAPAGSWTDTTSSSDPLATSYSGGSYHVASTQGATATITFTGTGITLLGGRKPNYGTYSFSVDGQIVSSGSAQANDQVAQQILGSVEGLAYGSHTAVLTNTGGNPVDLDRIDFQTQIGQAGAVGVKKTIDDSDSSIVYSPSPSDWQVNSNAEFFDGSLHFTNTPGASASLTFSGDAVAVWGTVSPDHADINMELDGNSQTLPGGSGGMASVVHPQVLLFYKTDLGPGQHTLSMSGASQNNANGFIDLDMVNVFDAAVFDPSSTTTSSGRPPTGTPSSGKTAAVPSTSLESSSSPGSPVAAGTGSSGISKGAIAGAVIGALLGLALLLGLLGFLFLRRRRARSRSIEKSMISVSPVLPMQGDPRALESGMRSLENPVFPFPPPRARTTSSRLSIAPSYYSDPEFSGHSRGGSTMSALSTAPLVSQAPIMELPQSRSFPRKPVPAKSGLSPNGNPARPSHRPPTMDFVNMDN
ncbi:hypothetical protein CPC08DRAFT_702790 [Agrocybe pediades]|nr:hypothetical protein CPC08DRAFT_702790 [Agrocybe pediades]